MSIDKTKSEQLSDEIKIEELSREIEIEQFIKKMKEKKKFNNEMLSYNMVINGRWGDGKTTFLKQIEEHIKNNKDLGIDSNNIIKISAWDYDFLDNPAQMILDILDKKENEVIKKISNVISSFSFSSLDRISLFSSSLSDIITSFSSSLSEEMVEQNIIWRIIKRTKDKIKDKNESGKKHILNFNDLKLKIKNSINTSDDVYIFIDDLDRCNPNFIIKLFEVLKHLFNIENVVIIYMLDFENINECIMNYYHLPIKNDANENYLSKIIDYVHDLDEIDKTSYLLNKYDLLGFQNLKDLKDLKKFLGDSWFHFWNDFSNDILITNYHKNIMTILEEKSFREQEKIVSKIADINHIYNIEIIEKNANILRFNYQKLAFYLIAFSLIEYISNKNILDANNMLKKINEMLFPDKNSFYFIKEIYIFFENIYIHLGFDIDIKEHLGYIESLNFNEYLNYIDNDFEKDFLNLIKKCC